MNVPIAASFSDLPGLPFLVFFAELCVVTLSTLRIIFIARGNKMLPPVLGFFEISIWLFAIGKVMQNLSDPGCFLGFAGGFTLGNFLGVMIESWLALGNVVVRTITHRDATVLIDSLKAAQFGVTSLDAEGGKGPVKMVFTVVRRKELETVLAIIRSFDPNAFYSVDEIQEAGSGIFPENRRVRGALPSILQLSRRVA
ncbi:MAG: DUF2179 domain-containing protein [Planctomycetota bacterium]|nr:MAG: DUF2179 domain-containing protein [Planctomycetota bacterium]